MSPDTDVLILALHYISTTSSLAPGIDLLFQLLTSKGRKSFSINAIVDFFGPVSSTMLGLYVYTGCDHIGRFRSITKDRTFKTFMKSVIED